MKKLITATAILGALTVAALLAACGQPTTPGAVEAKGPATNATVDLRTPQEIQLDEVWRQTMLAIELGTSATPDQRDAMYTALQEIEDVQRTLAGIDEAQGMLMGNLEHQGATTEEIDGALAAFENARQEVLARVGLGY